MSYLSEEQYTYRRESAARHLTECAENPNLTENQHATMADICDARHWLHCESGETLYCTEGPDYTKAVALIFTDGDGEVDGVKSFQKMIKESKIGYDTGVFNGLSDELNDIPRDCDVCGEDTEGSGSSEESIERFDDILAKVNAEVEKFLRYVDNEYGTDYCPSGANRCF
jgi:hypothetical protein